MKFSPAALQLAHIVQVSTHSVNIRDRIKQQQHTIVAKTLLLARTEKWRAVRRETGDLFDRRHQNLRYEWWAPTALCWLLFSLAGIQHWSRETSFESSSKFVPPSARLRKRWRSIFSKHLQRPSTIKPIRWFKYYENYYHNLLVWRKNRFSLTF